MRVPQSILHAQTSDVSNSGKLRSQLWTKVVVIDDSVKVEGEGAPNVASLFKGKTEAHYSVNGYACDLADLPIILLQQVHAKPFCTTTNCRFFRRKCTMQSGTPCSSSVFPSLKVILFACLKCAYYPMICMLDYCA